MGVCNAAGSGCTCTDPQHWLASERCSTWHETTTQPPTGSPHQVTAVNGQSVSNPAGTTLVPAGATVQLTIRVPSATQVPAEVHYYLSRNFTFQSATAGAQSTLCQPAVFAAPFPNGVQGTAQVLDCNWSDATTPLVITAIASGTSAPRDDPYAAVACFAPFTTCFPARMALQLPPGTVATVGPQRTAIIVANASGASAHPYANAANTASVFFASANPNSAQAYFRQSSYGPASIGAITLAGANGGEGTAADVYGPFTVTTNGCMGAADGIAAASSAIDFSHYERVLVIAHDPTFCGGGGLTGPVTVSANNQPKQVSASILYNDAFGERTLNGRVGSIVLHEYGHQLGRFTEGGGWECGAAAQAGDGTCNALVYLDLTDVMGSANYAHYSAVNKDRIGWLEGGRALPIWSTGRYVINAYEDGTENVKVLKVPRRWRQPGATDAAGLTSGSYYLTARRPTAPWTDWTTTSGQYLQGVAVYLDEGGVGSNEALMDMTPGSIAGPSDFSDGALLTGQTFTDPLSGVTLSVVEATSSTATIDVTIQPRSTRYVAAGSSDPNGRFVPGAHVAGVGAFTPGSTVSVTAQPPPGFTFGIWLDSHGTPISEANPYSFPLNEDTWLWALLVPEPPANDNFVSAQPVTSLPSQFTAYTANASIEVGEPHQNIPCGPITIDPGATAWYAVTLATTQNVTIDTQGTDYGAEIVVYTGTSLGSLTQVPGACDFFQQQELPTVTFTANAGTTYYVQVGASTLGQNLVVHFTAAP
jgi:hypothetical protein